MCPDRWADSLRPRRGLQRSPVSRLGISASLEGSNDHTTLPRSSQSVMVTLADLANARSPLPSIAAYLIPRTLTLNLDSQNTLEASEAVSRVQIRKWCDAKPRQTYVTATAVADTNLCYQLSSPAIDRPTFRLSASSLRTAIQLAAGSPFSRPSHGHSPPLLPQKGLASSKFSIDNHAGSDTPSKLRPVQTPPSQ